MNKSNKISWLRLVIRHAAAFLAIALITAVLIPLGQTLEIKTITLLYLLVVMASTVLLGLAPGVLASFVAFLALNFYFIQPYYTFEVHNTLDLITLIVFLIVSVVMSQLIGQAREGRQAARSREWEATRMYELISTLAGLHDARDVAQALADHTLETFHLERAGVLIEARPDASSLAVFSPPGEIPRERPRIQLALKTAREQEGWLRLWYNHSALTP
jgi:K+-sensing histidine kinase KdpD